MNHALDPSLFHRLALIRDLGVRGAALLDGSPNSFDRIQGLVVLDLAIETALKTVVAELDRQSTGDRFRNLLDAVPELQGRREDMARFRDLRNAAQHRGTPPAAPDCAWARHVGAETLRHLFILLKADFDTLSSVGQLRAPYFRDPLRLALEIAGARPADAAALAACAMRRVRGWISQATGDALVPHEMWVFHNELWNDTVISAACADKRDVFLHAMLTLAAGATMGIGPPELIRFSALTQGHRATANGSGPRDFEYTHDDCSSIPTARDVAWMVELVARCALRFETEWPDLVLREEEP
jgi:hypothetical protein